MSSNLRKVLLVGTGYMGVEHCKVLLSLGIKPVVVGRSRDNCLKFYEKTGIDAFDGGISKYLEKNDCSGFTAIIAVSIDSLAETAILLLNKDVKSILLEKPGAMSKEELKKIQYLAEKKSANVFIAYNRRFYASTLAAQNIIKEDGGVKSFIFEFTEWRSDIESLKHSKEIKDIWLLANSSHVIDLAFFLGGYPKKMSSYIAGELPWHKRGAIYSGAGISDMGALFSYHANWDAPGRWSIEILTNKRRLIFRPMEKLQIQELNSVTIDYYDLDDEIDKKYKPGLYYQLDAFLNFKVSNLLNLNTYLEHFDIYEKISGYTVNENEK
ncbi:MAG: Gfo/Idh/MocA family oxidoreductase [Spirochaetales bacterium]|nr:Gfo/Idh/MocA family oxidoreductase [Spirochaetales bacterium]